MEYDKAWAQMVLANSLCRLKRECVQAGQDALYSAVEPGLIADEGAFSYTEIANKLGKSESSVRSGVRRLRARLKVIMESDVRQMVLSGEEFDREMRYLMELLGRSSRPRPD